MKIITEFLRLHIDGGFEKVTWLKSTTGEKEVQMKRIIPEPIQIKALHESKYNEITITKIY